MLPAGGDSGELTAKPGPARLLGGLLCSPGLPELCLAAPRGHGACWAVPSITWQSQEVPLRWLPWGTAQDPRAAVPLPSFPPITLSSGPTRSLPRAGSSWSCSQLFPHLLHDAMAKPILHLCAWALRGDPGLWLRPCSIPMAMVGAWPVPHRCWRRQCVRPGHRSSGSEQDTQARDFGEETHPQPLCAVPQTPRDFPTGWLSASTQSPADTSPDGRIKGEQLLAYLAFICGHKAQLWSGKCSKWETMGKPRGHSTKKVRASQPVSEGTWKKGGPRSGIKPSLPPQLPFATNRARGLCPGPTVPPRMALELQECHPENAIIRAAPRAVAHPHLLL